MNDRAFAPGRRVLLVGATGLVGQAALRQLLNDDTVSAVRALVRRPLSPAALTDVAAPNAGLAKLEVCVADFERLSQHPSWFEVDTVCCALGTTIKVAGSQAAFRRVDFDYPLEVARLARAQGARQFLLVSALGADARSRVFYSRVKGELEEAVRQLGFPHVSVARPSVLMGHRAEVRPGEWLALKFGWLFPAAYRPVPAERVAAGLLASARADQPGWHVLDNAWLRGMR
jgi:uncharacterized protein YbjT (DUF2867 family)